MIMKSSLLSAGVHFRFVEILPKAIFAWLLTVLLLSVAVLPLRAAEATNTLEIQSVSVNGKSLSFRGKESISLGSFPDNIIFGFGAATNAVKPPLRLRYTLEGYENTWHEYSTEMALTVRFYNSSGDQISQNIYSVNGESTGWTGSLKSSSLTHRRETLVVPPQATRLLIVISSAGPPETVGIYVVANLVVLKSSGNLGNVVLLQSPFDNDHGDHTNDDLPAGWMHDGTRPSMAKIVKFGQDPQTRAFAIVDEDKASHAEWHNIFESAPTVTPGDSLVVEWNEMYSMGSGNFHEAMYSGLSEGHYKFRVRGVDVMGMLIGVEASVGVFVPHPFWKTSWFWSLAAVAITAMIIGGSRYFVWHRMRREMVRLKQQRALEQERLRIAHDIHDDLGARVTQISLLSAMAQENPAFPDKARADFDKVSKMSRELVLALYETVWAVNPENDNLEALGNYLCQMVKQLCERTPLRCRFHVLDLPHEVQVSSQTRHNISLAVKEAVHNIIKHARASEVTIRMAFTDGFLDVSVHDDGSGFQPADNISGNGLSNMKQRLQNIGGSCFVESKPGQGTTVRLRLRIRPSVQGS
jgi:signal transduction histidine kinase